MQCCNSSLKLVLLLSQHKKRGQGGHQKGDELEYNTTMNIIQFTTIKNDEGLNGELAYLKKDDAHHCSVTTFPWSSCSSFHNTEKKGKYHK
jgi:hypothetical protein